jgi:hypothetical protein
MNADPRLQEIVSVRKTKASSRKRMRVSRAKWEAKFDAIVAESKEATLVLSRWGFVGLSDGFVKVALWFYFCAPGKHEAGTALQAKMNLRHLCRQMVAVADDLEKILDLFGDKLLATLNEVDKVVPPKLSGMNGQKISELAGYQPKLLRVCASVFGFFSDTIDGMPADRKLVSSRALAWLFLTARSFTTQSKAKTYSQIATLLDAANQASGNPERFSSTEEVRARISRFQKAFPSEVAWIRCYLENNGMPPNAHDFVVLLTFGPAFYRLLHQ